MSTSAKIAAHAYALLAAVLLVFLRDPASQMVGTGIIAAPVYALLAFAYSRSGIPFNPLSFHFAWYTAGLGLAPIYFGMKLRYEDPLSFGGISVDGRNLAYGYFLCLLGSFVLHVITLWLKPKDAVPTASRKISPTLAIFVFALALPVIILPPDLLFSGSLAVIVQWGPFAILMLLALREPRPKCFWFKMLLGMGLLIGSTVFSLQLTYKMFTVLATVPLLTYLWRKHKRALIFIGPMFAAAYLLIIAPTINKSRDFRDLSGTERLTQAFNSYSLSDVEIVGNQYAEFMGRVFDPFSVGFIASQAQVDGFKHGETMDNLVYGFVPRILWPEKPNVTKGFWFSKYLGFARSEKEATTSTAMTHVGELYWNWGLPGVVVGMFVIAVLYAGLWNIASRIGLGTIWGMLIYFIVTVNMINPSEASTAILSAVILYLVIFGMWAVPKLWKFLVLDNIRLTAPGHSFQSESATAQPPNSSPAA